MKIAKTFLLDILGLILIPLRIIIFLVLPFLLIMALMYPIPLVAHFWGEDAFFAGKGFYTTLIISDLIFGISALLVYHRLARTENRFAEFFTAREARVLILFFLIGGAFTNLRFVEAYQSNDMSIIGRNLSVVHQQWYHFATDPAAHYNNGEECEACLAFENKFEAQKGAEEQEVEQETTEDEQAKVGDQETDDAE